MPSSGMPVELELGGLHQAVGLIHGELAQGIRPTWDRRSRGPVMSEAGWARPAYRPGRQMQAPRQSTRGALVVAGVETALSGVAPLGEGHIQLRQPASSFAGPQRRGAGCPPSRCGRICPSISSVGGQEQGLISRAGGEVVVDVLIRARQGALFPVFQAS